MYTLYLDESGDWGYPNYHARYPILCLCGCILKDDYYTKMLVPPIKALKRRTFGRNVVLHRHKVQNRKGDFSVLRTPEHADAFITAFSRHVASMELTILLSAVDKAKQYRTYGLRRIDPYLPTDLYSVVFTFAVERFTLFLLERGATGRIIAESRGRKENQTVQYWYSLLMQNGSRIIRDWQFRHVLPTSVEFRPKGDNVIGLQLADWIAWPMSKKIQYPNGEQDKYGEWNLYKGKIWLGQNAPARGQVGFKVFPKNLGRKLLDMPPKSTKDSSE